MYNQKAPTKPCPRCGTGRVYTANDRGGAYNDKIDGQAVCPDCKFDDILENARKKVKAGS